MDAQTTSEDLPAFWAKADDLVDQYLQSITFLHGRAKRAGAEPYYQLDLHRLDTFVERRRDVRGTRDESARRRGHAIDPDEPGFREAVHVLQEEIKRHVSARLEGSKLGWKSLFHVENLIQADVPSLEDAFGTPSNAWDLLVTLKTELSQPAKREHEIDAWLISVVSEGERFLREMITLTLTTVAPNLLPEIVLTCFNDPPDGLEAHFDSTVPEALAEGAEHLGRFLEQGSRQTSLIASRVARALGFSLYPESSGFDPGFVTVLSWLGESSEQIWFTLMESRRDLLHSTSPLESLPRVGALSSIHKRGAPDLALVTDFVGALGLRFGLSLLDQVLKRSAGIEGDSIWHQGLVWKMPGQLRTLMMLTLREARWPFAWAMAEMALDVEPPGSFPKMLGLNALFARQRMQAAYGVGDEFFDPIDLERFDVAGDDPRYELIKRSMLRQFGGVDALLDHAIQNDLTLYEIESWPAFWELRQSAEYRRWRKDVSPPVQDVDYS